MNRYESTYNGRTLIVYAESFDAASEMLRQTFDLPDGLLLVVRLAEPLDPSSGYEGNPP